MTVINERKLHYTSSSCCFLFPVTSFSCETFDKYFIDKFVTLETSSDQSWACFVLVLLLYVSVLLRNNYIP